MSTPVDRDRAAESTPPPTFSNALTTVSERLHSALSGRFRIDRELGSGGMATVYLAHDLRHGRAIAVKVFREALPEGEAAERFLREIRIAAQLQHPHIVALLDSGDAAGLLYYFMPFVDGETLRAKLRREGTLSVQTAIHIAREVADALSYAHRHGIIHRDIKPENILLADGHALVADFGIARAMDVAGSNLTHTGLALGTPIYMAPEQALGTGEIDPRADLFALGCVLHEMLTGAPPYGGATPQATMLRRFTQMVPLLRAVRPDVPQWLEVAVTRMLATDPQGRPTSASEVLEILAEQSATVAGSTSGARPGRPRSIAVLPFANMSADAENEYFADGISEELINALAQFPGLRVIARTSSFAFKGKNVDIREIGRALGVSHVVEGSVRKSESALRITGQLIDAIDGSHLWSARYDRTLADAFAIQDEITFAIRDAIGASLLAPPSADAVQTDQETYDLFLRGRALLLESSTRVDEANELLAQATRRDPHFLPAVIALADSYFFQGIFAKPPRSVWPLARALAEDIALRDPTSTAADRILGTLLAFADHDFVAAETHLRQAIARNQSDVMAHGFLALVLVVNGRPAEADLHNRRGIALDPLGTFAHFFAANNWAVAGQFDDAEVAASTVIEIDPRYPEGYHIRGYTRNYMGRFEDADDDLARVPGLGNRSGWPLAKRAIALAGLGRFDAVRRILSEMLVRSETEFMTPDAVACVFQLLGRNDEAFAWLDRAVEAQALWTGFIGVDPIFAPLRRDVRFAPFCRANGLPVRPLPPSALDDLLTPS